MRNSVMRTCTLSDRGYVFRKFIAAAYLKNERESFPEPRHIGVSFYDDCFGLPWEASWCGGGAAGECVRGCGRRSLRVAHGEALR
ncbi:hypothetical protein DPEC_G00335550 [Dallia pectoralis]|uniref:Uncharacterized protein n=1 Tax=Dallia pectoralis TaxID=75939 RepID=A0ACC2F713_DALPE|nr:hypothetical protein DPEC_G00335550 [Dallia pectoralis]